MKNTYSHKMKTIFCVVLVAVMVGLTGCSFFDDGYSAKVYEDAKAVETIFMSDQGVFTDMAHLLIENEPLFDYLESVGRGHTISGPSIQNRKEYLSDEEYEQICSFLNTYQPYSMGPVRAGPPQKSISFVFLCRSEDIVLHYTELEGDKLERYLQYVGQDGVIKELGNHWYSVVRPSETVREMS